MLGGEQGVPVLRGGVGLGQDLWGPFRHPGGAIDVLVADQLVDWKAADAVNATAC